MDEAPVLPKTSVETVLASVVDSSSTLSMRLGERVEVYAMVRRWGRRFSVLDCFFPRGISTKSNSDGAEAARRSERALTA